MPRTDGAHQGQNPEALLLFWGFDPYSRAYPRFDTEEAAAFIHISANKSNVWHPAWEIFKFQIKPAAAALQNVRGDMIAKGWNHKHLL